MGSENTKILLVTLVIIMTKIEKITINTEKRVTIKMELVLVTLMN